MSDDQRQGANGWPREVTEHPVLIPTSQGLAGGIVCEPDGPPRAAAILLQGGGRSGRSGFNSEWVHLSRRMAALGTTVLRFDFCKEGDSSMAAERSSIVDASIAARVVADRALLWDVAAWFRGRTEGLGLIVVGSCYGARLGVELAGKLPAVTASLLVVPALRSVSEDSRVRWKERMRLVRGGQSTDEFDQADPDPLALIDPAVIEAFESILPRASLWVLIGERDPAEVTALEPALSNRGLEIEIEPNVALYPGNDPDIQELVSDRIAARLRQALGLTG